MALIQAFEKEEEVLEILWLVGLIERPPHGWQVRTVTRGVETGQIKLWLLPIGLLPLISPGLCFHKGDRMKATLQGEVRQFQIDNVGKGEEVTTDSIPPELYSFYGRKRGVQRLLRYRENDTEYLVPTIEMVRYLFLHNKTMANTLMHPGGILELFRPEQIGFHERLHLHFTAKMPLAILSREFVAEFAWTAIEPDARRSWDSVSTLSKGQEFVRFCPPPLADSNWTVRLVSWKNMALVLEIDHATGKRHPCNLLHYSHPSITQSKTIRSKSLSQSGGASANPPKSLNISDYAVDDGTAGSRTDVHQSAVDIPVKASSFDRIIKIKKIRTHVPRAPDGENGEPRKKFCPRLKEHLDRIAHRRVRVAASVAEARVSATLPPIEFRLLDPVDPNYLGELEPLIDVLRRMVKMFPTVNIAMALCSLKKGRPFSMAGRHRRACLIAIFWPPEQPPSVLIEVDHSGQFALSSLLLKYQRPCLLSEIEEHLIGILNTLVDHNGRWQVRHTKISLNIFDCIRVPRLMRTKKRSKNTNYQKVWAKRLAKHLNLSEKPQHHFTSTALPAIDTAEQNE